MNCNSSRTEEVELSPRGSEELLRAHPEALQMSRSADGARAVDLGGWQSLDMTEQPFI